MEYYFIMIDGLCYGVEYKQREVNCNLRSYSQGASPRGFDPTVIEHIFAFFGSLDGPDQN